MSCLLIPHLYGSLILKSYSDTETAQDLDMMIRRIRGLMEMKSRAYDMYHGGIIDFDIYHAIFMEYISLWRAKDAFIMNSPMFAELQAILNEVYQFTLAYLTCESVQVLSFGFDRFRVENITDECLSNLNTLLDEKFGAKIVRDD